MSVIREGRPYLYLPNSPDSSGRLILECLERLRYEGNMHLLGDDESPAGLPNRLLEEALAARFTDAVTESDDLRRERDRLAAEVARLNSSRMLKLGRPIRRMLGRPDD